MELNENGPRLTFRFNRTLSADELEALEAELNDLPYPPANLELLPTELSFDPITIPAEDATDEEHDYSNADDVRYALYDIDALD